MVKRVAVGAMFLLMSLSLSVTAQNSCVPVYARTENEVAFKAGEKLDFVMHYKFGIVDSDIGTASITLDTVRLGNVKTFHTRVTGQTSKIFDHFFRVREDFNSWFTCDGLQPVRFTRDTHEGDYIAKNDFNYLWDASEPVIDARIYTTTIGEEKQMSIPLKECTFDLPSLFFFARNIDMRKVRQDVKYPMRFAIDEEVYDVYFIYRGRQKKKVSGLGTINCIVFDAALLEGEIFKGKDDLRIYVSDDANRLPVLFGAPILVGEVEGRMVACKGLKYPFSSKIK